jgi:serine/threonine-protein kinase
MVAMLIGQNIGPFAIERELGCGAMGAVYLARYTKTGQRVAIKVMAPGMCSNKTALARFEREAAILKQLRHPNIVRLFATGRFHSTPFYAMEFIQGESLDHVMARRGRITWEQLVALGQQLCAALQYAHEMGIVHRDLKPSNLMVLSDDTVKLTDFGIAKDLDVTALTSANCTVGTAAYMSPEQCRGERNLTHKSDLYSMGVMFFELMTGRKPFLAETAMDMFMQHVNGKFERPSRLVPEMPVWLDTLVCQLLEKDPDKRPLNAAAVGEALGRIREKVEAQQSAGVDAAKRRVIDRTEHQERFDDTDRAAARALLRKKPKKKKAATFSAKGWLQGAGIVVLLLAISAVMYYTFFSRPSPQSLLEQARPLMESGDSSARAEARKGPLQRFLDLYPDLRSPEAEKMNEWADRVDLEQETQSLVKRVNSGMNVNRNTEDTTACTALKLENEGKLADAKAQWNKLEDLKSEKADREKRALGLLAESKLKTLNEVDRLQGALKSELDEKGTAALPADTDSRGKALRALSLESSAPAKAADIWNELRLLNEVGSELEDANRRVLYLLASRKILELKSGE